MIKFNLVKVVKFIKPIFSIPYKEEAVVLVSVNIDNLIYHAQPLSLKPTS